MDKTGESVAQGTAGPVRKWITAFRQGQATQVDAMLIAALLAFMFLGLSMMLAWVYLVGPDWYDIVKPEEFFTLYIGVPLVWYAGTLAMRRLALNTLRPWLADGLLEQNLLGSELGRELMEGGDGGSFKRSLQRLSRRLPGFIRRSGLGSTGPWNALGLATILSCAALAGLMLVLHAQFGRWLEYPILFLVLGSMLLHYRLRLDACIRQLALADYLLGSFGLDSSPSQTGIPQPPPKAPPPPKVPE